MRIVIENIAQVAKADIEISGITSLIGYNSTGKSTISKSLASICDAFSDFDQRIERIKSAEILKVIEKWKEENNNELRKIRNLKKFMRDERNFKFRRVFSTPGFGYSYWEEKFRDLDDIDSFKVKMRERYDLDEWENFLDEVKEEAEIDLNIEEMLDKLYKDITDLAFGPMKEYEKNIIERSFNQYFSGQISSLYNQKEGKVQFFGEDDKLNQVNFKNNKLCDFKKGIVEDIPITYIQPYNILDSNRGLFVDRGEDFFPFRRNIEKYSLIDRLKKEFPISALPSEVKAKERVQEAVDEILKDIDSIGELTQSDEAWQSKLIYRTPKYKHEVSMGNVASGIKNMVVIKRLAANGELKENSILIIDEPEVNLHPEWQLKLAEVLVNLYKKANIKIFINTHSPYFIRAIEYYSDKLGILDKNKFYLMQNKESKNGIASTVMDKTKSLGDVYEAMSTVLDKLMDGEDNEI